MPEISRARRIALRALYLFIVTGMAIYMWPDILAPNTHWKPLQGQANCMLAAFSMMCLLGLRYPVQMLPVLLWEVTWKTMWLVLVPLPQWWAGHVDDAIKPAIFAISMVVLVYAAIPWRQVFAAYVTNPAEAWW